MISQVRFIYNGNAFLLFLWFLSLFDILDAPEKSRLQMGGGLIEGGFNSHLQWYLGMINALHSFHKAFMNRDPRIQDGTPAPVLKSDEVGSGRISL